MSALSSDTTPSAGHFAGTAALGGIPPRPTSPRRAPSWLKLIQEAVEASDFGTIQIKVHAGEVVQIEATRKIRVPSGFPHTPLHPTASAEEQQPRH